MGRKRFIIENENDSKIAWVWIKNQEIINDEFEEIADYQFSEMNTWCEKFLNGKQWKRLKITIRAKKLKKKVTISIDIKSHIILKELSKSYNVTLSELIINKLESEWINLPEPEEQIQLPTTIEEYNTLVENLKNSEEWIVKHGKSQNVARILKSKNILLPNDIIISKTKLDSYLKNLKK